MATRATAYPLSWPDGWARSKQRGNSQFRTSLAGALKNVETEIAHFAKDSGRKVENIVISSNVTLGEQKPKDPGVAIYFSWDGITTCIAVDRYEKVEDNLQAIYHCLEAERTKLRHGGLNLVRAAFRGYAALPPPDEKARSDWPEILGVPRAATRKDVEEAWRRVRSKTHPDRGGSSEAFHKAERAYAAALEAVG